MSKRSLFRLTLRSLLLQCSWNFKQLQGLGWAWLLIPELRRLYAPTSLRPIVQRYLGYFNSNIFLVPTIAAAVLSLERQQRLEQPVSIASHAFSEAVMAPFAAAGDAFFWGGLRPLCCTLAVAGGALGYWWSPLLFLALFNLPVFIVRLIGPWLGYSRGVEVVLLLQRWHIADIAIVLKRLTVVCLGGVAAIIIHHDPMDFSASYLTAAGVLLTIVSVMIVLRKGLPLVVVLVGLCGLVVSIEYAFFTG
ncbi:MAG: PTS system mannose/fructose/sorbose family transporter subunit IID [Desulfuromonas sp.]|nr:PTS system mannose/fructose/sorbose family transporter subunit IID [Desulfuromonas sp.]